MYGNLILQCSTHCILFAFSIGRQRRKDNEKMNAVCTVCTNCELHMHALHERIRAITAYIYIYIVLIYQRCVISSIYQCYGL